MIGRYEAAKMRMLKMYLTAVVMAAGTLFLPAWQRSTQTMPGGLQKPSVTELPAKMAAKKLDQAK